jgi:hypothetical protein
MAIIKPRRGTTAPTTGTINQNELAVDTTNKRIYIGAADGSGTLIGSAPGGSDTQIQFNNSGNFGGDADLTFDGTNLQIGSQGDLRLADSDSSNYVAFQAPATVANNNIYTLPSAVGSANQVLQIASVAGNDATLQWATVSGGGAGLTWSATTADATMAVDNGYLANKSSGTLTLTLPTTAAVGKTIRVSGMQNTWRIAQNASQIIHFGKSDTTTGTGGYLESSNARDAVELVCCVANNEWNVISSIGNITIV